MIEKQNISDDLIINCLNTKYGIEVSALLFLPLGADINASVYKVQACDQTSYFVKLKRGHHHDISVTILSLLQSSGIQEIIPPIKTTHGKPTQHIDDFTLIVYPFVEGQNGFCYNLIPFQKKLISGCEELPSSTHSHLQNQSTILKGFFLGHLDIHLIKGVARKEAAHKLSPEWQQKISHLLGRCKDRGTEQLLLRVQ